MAVRKVSKKEWSKKIETAVRKREFEQELEKSINKKLRWKRVKKEFPIPFALGLFACFFVVQRFGWFKLEEILLSWVIGITFVTFILTWFNMHK